MSGNSFKDKVDIQKAQHSVRMKRELHGLHAHKNSKERRMKDQGHTGEADMINGKHKVFKFTREVANKCGIGEIWLKERVMLDLWHVSKKIK